MQTPHTLGRSKSTTNLALLLSAIGPTYNYSVVRLWVRRVKLFVYSVRSSSCFSSCF